MLTARLMSLLQLPTLMLDGLQADHVCIVFSFCVYVDAVCIPVQVPLILLVDNCKRLWYFCLQVFR